MFEDKIQINKVSLYLIHHNTYIHSRNSLKTFYK